MLRKLKLTFENNTLCDLFGYQATDRPYQRQQVSHETLVHVYNYKGQKVVRAYRYAAHQ